MELEKDTWKSIDLNVDSLCLMGPRAKGGKRENNYHGNFAPQIPDEMIRRYTTQGETVLDMFMGSGTALFECETLKRNYIGFDINDEMVQYVQRKMEGCNAIQFKIENCDISDEREVRQRMVTNLQLLKSKKVSLVLSHPPYLDVVKFTDKPEDLSHIDNVDRFVDAYIKTVQNVWDFLKSKGFFVLVVGDAYKNSEVIPLGFYLMYAMKKAFKCQLKGIVVKDIVNNRGKIGTEAIHRYRALKYGYYIFKHEYIFVFKKL